MFTKIFYLFWALVLLLGLSAPAQTIVWISETNADAQSVYFDQGWIDLLEDAGYTVDFRPGEWMTLDVDKLATLESADLIIASRNSNSGNYASDATEVTQWNSVPTPLIMMTAYWCRNNRWLWINDTTIEEYAAEAMMQVVDSAHPVFEGIKPVNGLVDVIDETVNSGQNSFILTNNVGNGTLIAQREDNQAVWIAEWAADVEFYEGSGQIPAEKRMLFLAGGGGGQEAGSLNLNDDGIKMFLNAVKYMIGGGSRLKAYGPNPADGDTYADTWVNLSWEAGVLAVSHDVYLGDNFDDVNNATHESELFRGNQTEIFYAAGFPGYAYPEGLIPGTTYYWRIDEVNDADPNSPWKGDVWSFSIPPKTAYNPVPADGAEFVPTDAMLSWTAGYGAKIHYVVFGKGFDEVNNTAMGVPNGTTTFNPGPLELARTYYWRVDEFDGADTYKGEVWSFTTEGAVSGPNPANGAVDVSPTKILTWVAGDVAASHEVYFGMDADAVANATKTSPEYKGAKALGEESYDPGMLLLETMYYWRIDEVNDISPDSPWIGNVWSFTTGDFFVIDDFEDYDAGENQIWYAWHDGLGYGSLGTDPYFSGNGTGAAVGDETTSSYTEEIIVHGGSRSMPISYDNNKQGFAMYSEAELTLDAVRDWTDQGVTELSLWFRGNPVSVGSFVEGPVGTYTMTASGTDIWNAADEFHFAYKTLSGVGTIVAQVLSVDNTDPWAKAGVMFRETLEPGSKFAAVYITPGNGCRFQARVDADAAATSDTSVVTSQQTAITAPYWIKFERDFAGNFRAYYSSNGSTWQLMSWGAQNISMGSNVYVGLAVTSHNAAATCEAKFSNVTITGTVGAQWMNQDIGILSNDPEPLYVAVSNSSGNPAVVVHDDPAAANIDTWTEWIIPFQTFADQGINLTNVDKLAIGLGTKGNMTIPGGSGKMYFDDIRLIRPTEAAE
jgi:hypothetical protein